MGEVVPFRRGRAVRKGGPPAPSVRDSPSGAQRKSGLARYRDAASVQEAQQCHAAGLVRPWRISAALDMRGLFGPEVDAACGVAEPAVDLWEAGRLYPSWEQLLALARLTGFPVGFFVRDGEPVDPESTSIAIHERARLGARYVASKPPVLAFTVEALRAAGVPVGPRSS